MSEYIAEEFTQNGYIVKIIQDQDAMNPRKEYGNVGTMVCWSSRYDLGDVQKRRDDSPDDFLLELAEEFRPGLRDYLGNALWRKMVTAEYPDSRYEEQKKAHAEKERELVWKLIDANYIILPLGLIDHSGISMYIGSHAHSCDPGGWDSGQVGWIYCTKAKAIEEWGKGKRLSPKVRKRAEKYLESEVKTYDQYLTGDVYGFVIETPDGEEVDSCWGHFGLEWAIQAAKENVPKEPALVGGESQDAAMEETLA